MIRGQNNYPTGGKRFKGKEERETGHRVNREIRAAEIRLISDDGAMLGVMSVQEALSIAQSKNLDLIEIAPTAKPPTCKIMDYGKWRYENKKKEKAAKKKQTNITLKEIQLRPRTDTHDRDVKLKHARRFLLDGDKVKFNLRFTGREMAHQDLGIQLLEEIMKSLDDLAIVETSPKREGRHAFAILAPDAVKVKEYEKKNQHLLKEKLEPLIDEPINEQDEDDDL